MKLTGKILICLAGGLALNSSLRADNVLLPGNPYAPVVVRNIFGLNPPPVVDPNATPAEPPVKITPNGIMTIFGQLQVLFKVAGKPPGQDGYILTEGQRQDDIEVTKIDEKAGIVTFNNHGIVQALPLVAATPTSGAAPASSFGIPPPGGNPGANGFNNRFGNRGGNFPGRNRGGGNGYNDPGNSGGNNSGGMNTSLNGGHASVQNPLADQLSPGLTPEVQIIAIEANRIATQSQVDSGELPPLPITELTPDANASQ
ncbi:MAG TPA: hypothetical protein VHY30_03840 [Verrucomicrobiae bacterium]|jgi:hypothetical protein|nr:hypothetical protein [Verrucomicrobiae bacterium]